MVPEPRSAYALQFFLLATFLLLAAGALSIGLIQTMPVVVLKKSPFSPAFSITSCLLLAGSFCMYRAVESVRRERQQRFRFWLESALVIGTFFVGVQTYALSSLIRQQLPSEASTVTAAFVAVFATLHAMHFVIALLFLCYITVQAFADRYDHEYFWGVVFCAWFWHALGVVWLAILSVMFIASFFN